MRIATIWTKLLMASFKNKNYDEGLLEGVHYVQTTLKTRMPAGARKGRQQRRA